MKAVLLSIRPEWCKKILDGEKTVEVRKTRPKLETPFRVYVYCTLAASKEFKLDDRNWDVSAKNRGDWAKKRGRVIGEFTCDKIWELAPICHAPDDVEEQACMDRDYIVDYLRCKGCGWHISDLKIYDQPRELRAFTGLQSTRFGMRPVEITRPPQSWRYVEELSSE